MKYIKTYYEFACRVGMLVVCDGLDIEPSIGLATFCPNRLNELMEFCKKNPSYHIVSMNRKRLHVNKAIYGDVFYFLADRDSDPTLAFLDTGPSEEDRKLLLKVLKLVSDKSKAVSTDIKGSN